MPEKQEFLPMSLVTFTKAKNEEIFLLYSKGFEEGPGIHRNGQGSPWMIDRETQSRRISEAHEQRRGTWLVNKDARQLVLDSIPRWTKNVITKRDANLMDPADAEHRLRYYEALRNSLAELPDYHSTFERAYPDRTVIGMQGCGNLSMNEWYVAYLRSAFTDHQPIFIALPEDRIDRVPSRHYTCLVKYNDGNVKIQSLTFNFLKRRVFLAPPQVSDLSSPPSHPLLRPVCSLDCRAQ